MNLTSFVGLEIASMGRGSVGPEIVGLRREPIELVLVLARGSVGLAREPDAVRANHFVGLEKKLEIPDGDEERVIEGKEGEGLTPAWLEGSSRGGAARFIDVFEDCPRRIGISRAIPREFIVL